MPYGRRIDWQGAMHHVMSRGINGLEILKSTDSKKKMLSLLDRYLPDTGTKVHAWALMNNHFHLLVETGSVPLSSVMHRLLTAFSIWYNLTSERTGRVFQGRYRSILIDEEEYFFAVVDYINRNPLRAGYVPDEESLYGYSFCGHSYHAENSIAYRWESSASSPEKSSESCESGIHLLKKHVVSGLSAEKINNGNHQLSSSGLTVKKTPALSEKSQTWTGRTFILGNSSYIKDIIANTTDKRILPVRDRRAQHSMAVSALRSISRTFDLTEKAITGKSRVKQVVHARSLYIQYLIISCGFSYSDVARLLNRSRQSVRYMFNKQTNNELVKWLPENN